MTFVPRLINASLIHLVITIATTFLMTPTQLACILTATLMAIGLLGITFCNKDVTTVFATFFYFFHDEIQKLKSPG
jgi:hypothetical protein